MEQRSAGKQASATVLWLHAPPRPPKSTSVAIIIASGPSFTAGAKLRCISEVRKRCSVTATRRSGLSRGQRAVKKQLLGLQELLVGVDHHNTSAPQGEGPAGAPGVYSKCSAQHRDHVSTSASC